MKHQHNVLLCVMGNVYAVPVTEIEVKNEKYYFVVILQFVILILLLPPSLTLLNAVINSISLSPTRWQKNIG
ncbi:unnamed protein product [Periconia digitata]|uniref:Uncharacterized protein n=1 Tax=Periconia digitata TaxID=1303443 RepID=A0A9W4U416_9PLEO|nr:unnamed protein product [Periconia digitata]